MRGHHAPKQQDRENQKSKVERPNSQPPSNVEVTSGMLLGLAVEQDAGDQESREHEEQVDPDHSSLDDRAHGRGRHPERLVMDQHQQNGDCAQAIQLRNVLGQYPCTRDRRSLEDDFGCGHSSQSDRLVGSFAMTTATKALRKFKARVPKRNSLQSTDHIPPLTPRQV